MKERKVIAERVTEARDELGIDKKTLSDLSGISRVTISNIENKSNKSPSLDTMYQLACALHRPLDFFYTPFIDSYDEITEIAFRSYRSQSQRENKRAKVKLKRAEELTAYLYGYINGRSFNFNIPSIKSEPAIISSLDMEVIATQIREAFGIGNGPIIELTTFLENNGIICCSVDLPSKTASLNRTIKFDDLDGETAIIVYNSSLSYYRQRFSIAHELGHIMLHRYWDQTDFAKNTELAEDQANAFASAFLMPSSTFMKTLGPYKGLDGALALKEMWRTSIASICRRMYDLGVVSESQYSNMYIDISRKHWRTTEPGDKQMPVEEPYYLQLGYCKLFQEQIISPYEVLRATGLSAQEVSKYIGNEEYFNPVRANTNFELKQ